ncbi:actin polymerization protein [Lasallia pustulata]|uniref:Protein BZZ1 n=1 Tax=Lasallia pustulata TaxID=136370 RepID=A0A1W5D8A7_9LECA|nr:actin polymerization protein [Lasallia pustulata]
MGDVDITPRFGAELKDGFKPVNAWVSNGISWLDDIQQFYRERSAIEKEYSSKLNSLAKKFFEKKAAKSSSLSVGDTPSMTPGSLESASLTIWTTQLSTLESRAAEHDRFSSEILLQLAEPLKSLASRYEEIRKSHVEYAAKLEKERDASFGNLKKTKSRYDGACQEVENKRRKIDSSFDRSKQKAQNAYQQQIMDMHNVKNTYLIDINITNKQKERYYHEYVPDLLDSLQELSESRCHQLNSLWSHAAQLETSTLTRGTEHLKHLSSDIPRNDPRLDSIMFVRHNGGSWQEPMDMVFEPSPVWHDDDAMAVDDTAKIFLRNVLGKSKSQLIELKPEADQRRKELDNVRRIKQNIRAGKDKTSDEVELVRAMFSIQEKLHEIERKRTTAEIEMSTIKAAVGDVSLSGQNHNFKSETFKIPTNCDLCGERIWGLSAKGFDCRDCGYTCHSKCELKVPASCPGEQSKEDKKRLKAERQQAANAYHSHTNGSLQAPRAGTTELPTLSRSETMNSLSSGYAASAHRSVSGVSLRTPPEEKSFEKELPAQPAGSKPNTLRKNRVVAPPPAQYVSELPANEAVIVNGGFSSKASEPRGKMMYAYKANGDGEISVDEGNEVIILEPDDGSGWMQVRAGHTTGIVPASYVEILPHPTPGLSERPGSSYSNSSASLAGSMTTPGKKKGPAVAPKRGAKKLKYVEALYDYEARTESEWSMSGGERFVLVNKDAGDGWADVEKGGLVKSVPANYIQDI